MTYLLDSNEASSDWETMTARVVGDAKRLCRDLADDAALEESARRVVAEIWTDSIKVTSFVPVLALRRIRETLARENGHTIALDR